MESNEHRTDRKAARGSANRLSPVGFWSYARQDDDLSFGKLTALRSLLLQELQVQYGGQAIRLFQDANTIPHGADWEIEIKKAIDASSFFIPIITPSFVQSEWCCREVELFQERERELRGTYPTLTETSFIFPILFIGADEVEPENAEVIDGLRKLQHFDFRRFRHRSYSDPEVQEALSGLAASMLSVLRKKLPSPQAPPPPPPEPAAETPKAEPRPLAVGDVLNDIFEVKRFIKAGGMGQVFEGANVNTGERVAIKALLPSLTADEKIVALFRREAMTLTKLNHEALVQYRVLGKEPSLELLYIVTEYVDGIDLAETLGKVERDEAALRRLLARLAAGLGAAHRLGAIHRDVSPDNVMLPDGDLSRAKLIDFGIAKSLGGTLPTIIGKSFAGKLDYVAPEQLGDHGAEIGPWTDVYALALTVLAVARGKRAKLGGSFADAIAKRRKPIDVSAAPEALRPLLARMLEADPANRLRSMDEVIAWLDRPAQAPPPVSTPPVPPVAAPAVKQHELASPPRAEARPVPARASEPARPAKPVGETRSDAGQDERSLGPTVLIAVAAAVFITLALLLWRPLFSEPTTPPKAAAPAPGATEDAAAPAPSAESPTAPTPAPRMEDQLWWLTQTWCVRDAASGRQARWTIRAEGLRLIVDYPGGSVTEQVEEASDNVIRTNASRYVYDQYARAVTVTEGSQMTRLEECR